MAAERDRAKGAGQQGAEAVSFTRQPGRANRGFRSMDPERQRERGDEGGKPAPTGAAQSEGGAALRGTDDADQTQDPGAA